MTPSTSLIRDVLKPAFGLLPCSKHEATDIGYSWRQLGFAVTFVRAEKMRSLQGLFDEFAAALQFPWYFGENKDAFDECIADLNWMPAGSGYVVIVTDATSLLEESPEERRWFVSSINRARDEWMAASDLGGDRNRPPTPFHLLLQSEQQEIPGLYQIWTSCGAEIETVA